MTSYPACPVCGAVGSTCTGTVGLTLPPVGDERDFPRVHYVGDGVDQVEGYPADPDTTLIVERDVADGLISTGLYEEGEA